MPDRTLTDHALRLLRLLRLVDAEAGALGDTYRGVQAMLASDRPHAADWPVEPTLEIVVGAFRIARELEQLEDRLRRDAARLLTDTGLDQLVGLIAPERARPPRDRRGVAVEAIDEVVVWLRARLGYGSSPAG